jgi:hypothetical protein
MLRTITLLCSLSLVVSAQVRYPLNDSLSALLRKDSAHIFRKTLAKPYLKIDNRNSFILDQPIDFYGGMIGATFWDRHTLAAGYYFLDKKSRRPVETNGKGTTQQFLRLTYFNFAYQLVVLNTRYVQLNLPLEIGAGSVYAKTNDSVAVAVETHFSGRFIPYSAGLQAIGKITKWLGVSLTGGYRYVYHNKLNLQFNGVYYSYGVWIDARHLFRSFRYSNARKKYYALQERSKAK